MCFNTKFLKPDMHWLDVVMHVEVWWYFKEWYKMMTNSCIRTVWLHMLLFHALIASYY